MTTEDTMPIAPPIIRGETVFRVGPPPCPRCGHTGWRPRPLGGRGFECAACGGYQSSLSLT